MPVTNTRDELEKSLTQPNIDTHVFPKNLEEIDHWMAIRVNEFELFRKDDFEIKNDIARIFLPMPSSLGTGYSQNWNNEEYGLAGKSAAGLTQTKGDVQAIVDQITSIKPSDLGKSAMYYGLQAAESELAPIVAGLVSGVFSGVATAGAQEFLKGAIAGAGVARNPYVSVMYNSPSMRTHEFSWKMVPKSIEESEIIAKIIRTLKRCSSPSMNRNNPHFFDYPYLFDIDFHYSDYLFNIAPSVLSSLSVNYHGEGIPLYFDVNTNPDELIDFAAKKKAPVSVIVSATFQETVVVTREDIDEAGR